MKKRDKFLINNIKVLTISNFSSKILGFLLVPLYTNILLTKEVGEYDLIVSFISLLFPVLTVNISDGVMRFLMESDEKKSDVMSVGVRFMLYGMTAGIIIFFLLNYVLKVRVVKEYFYLILLLLFAHFFHNFMIQVSKGLEKVRGLSISGVLGTLVSLMLCFLLLNIFKMGIKGFYYVGIFGELIPAVYLYIDSKTWKYTKIDKLNLTLQTKMVAFCAPLIATAVGWWINSESDKYIVKCFCGASICGLLAVSYKIPGIINMFHNIFIQAWQISAIKEYGLDDTSIFYGKTFEIINFLMCAACSWLILLSKPIGYVLFKKDFFAAWQFAPFLLISCVFNNASGLLGPILSAQKASKPMALSAVYGAIANIVLNILFVFLIGAQGVTIATVIASFIIYIVRKKAVGNNIIISDYYIIIFTWMMLMAQAFFEVYFNLWLIELFIMLIMLYLNRKNFFFVLKFLYSKIQKS